MRGILRLFGSIVGGTIFFYTLFYLSLSLLGIFRPEFKELLADKMNTLSAMMSLVLFVSLLVTIALYCIVTRLVTGRWPTIYDARNEITALRGDVSSLSTEFRDSITNILEEVEKIDERLTKLEGQGKRAKEQTKETSKGKAKSKGKTKGEK